MDDLAKLLIALGVGIALVGGVLFVITRVTGSSPGRLPGDLVYQSGNLTCMVPIVTSIILSVVLTVVLNLILAALRR